MAPYRALAVAALLGAVVAVPARAAAPCRRVSDRLGDAVPGNGVPQASPVLSNVPSDPALDVTSADVASDRRFVTTVVRLAADTTALDPRAPGRDYLFSFRPARYPATVFTWVRFHPLAMPDAVWGIFDPAQLGAPRIVGPARLLTNRAGTELHATIDLDADPVLRSYLGVPGQTFTALHAESDLDVEDPNGFGFSTFDDPAVDTADSTARYAAYGPSCVRPGS
jgi:hypothetical protein